jgi:hypothetical protein
MFDQILQIVKDHLASNPQVAASIPDEQADAVHREIATHINNGIQNQPTPALSGSSLLSDFENSLISGNILTSAITGGLVSSLASKFGLPPLATGAIAAAIPGLLQKYANKSGTPVVSAGTGLH